MAGVTATVTAIAGIVGAYSAVKQQESAEKAQKEQKEMMEEQQDAERAEVQRQKDVALKKRKAQIDTQRRQMFGKSGDSSGYSISTTGDTGVETAPASAGTQTLTGQALGE